MAEKKIVAILLDQEDDEEPVYCTYNSNGEFNKLRDFHKKIQNQDLLKSIKQFFKFDLPYITYHDANPFELIDDECDSLNTRIFKFKDAVLERDTIIGNDIGFKYKKDRIEKIGEHFYLPGKPDLIWESYPFFKPDLQDSIELQNGEYYELYVKKFENLIVKKFKSLSYDDDELINLVNDVVTLQSPVEYQSYFTLHNGEFFDVFQYRIFQVIIKIFKVLKIMNENQLRKYFNDTDESYHPVLNESDNVSLKPIGSVATSSFAFGISDKDTQFLNALLVHVELVHLSLGIGEGYELYFNSTKKNFQNDKIHGLETTKINNFLKYFTKCVSICLNSKTNRFIIMDYYWIGVFEIEDIQDGEIEDVKKLVSKVKVRHFSYSNFEDDSRLSIRSIIGSFFNIQPNIYHKVNSKMDLINKRIIKDWELFKKSDYLMKNKSKKIKISPFTYSTPTGVEFQKQRVDLEKSLIKFIAIGYDWSCQTLSVNLKKLFQDKLHYSHLGYDGSSEVLLSIYDQQYDKQEFNFTDYYRDGNRLFTSKGVIDPVFGLSQKDRTVDESYLRWISSVDVYNKLKPLQGDVIAKVIDYGYLEGKPYNNGQDELHFKTDGYYIIYEPISVDFEDMMPIDTKDEVHFELIKETLTKIHKLGVSINPHTKLTSGVLRYYKGKIYIINLEETNSMATEHHKLKDRVDLGRMFNKNHILSKDIQLIDPRSTTNHKNRTRRASQSLEEHLFHHYDFSDELSESDNVDEDSAIY